MCLLSIFVLSCFIGYFVVLGVTPNLHSPLMSVSNAISGIIIIGGIIITSQTQTHIVTFLSQFSIFLASINIFGGFFLTFRMLEMFKQRKDK